MCPSLSRGLCLCVCDARSQLIACFPSRWPTFIMMAAAYFIYNDLFVRLAILCAIIVCIHSLPGTRWNIKLTCNRHTGNKICASVSTNSRLFSPYVVVIAHFLWHPVNFISLAILVGIVVFVQPLFLFHFAAAHGLTDIIRGV